jgi:hypothetical protein
MKTAILSFLLTVTAAVTLTVAALAQAAPEASTAPQGAAQAQPQEQVTVVGCVQRESDYRRAKDAGKGGVAGTGAGAGNEFVLINASMASGAMKTGEAASMAYELTGPNEAKVASHIGKRVEISGKLKPTETTASGRPTGGATAGKPPTGIDVVSKDLKLRELEVASVKEATGSCPAL